MLVPGRPRALMTLADRRGDSVGTRGPWGDRRPWTC